MTNAVVADATVIGALPFTSATVANAGYGTEAGESPGSTGYRTAWWRFTPTEDVNVDIDTSLTPNNGDTRLTLYSSSGPPHTYASLTLLYSNDDDPDGGGMWSRLANMYLVAGTAYFISVGSFSDQAVSYVLRVTLPPRVQPVPYDPALFEVERASSLSGLLGEFIIGQSRLGATGSGTWITVPLATFSYSNGYTPDENGTLIIDSESASVSLSFWDTPGDVLYPLDRIRVSYDGEILFTGVVDTTSLKYETDSSAAGQGAVRRVDFSANILGAYAIAMSKIVTYNDLPSETAIHRVRRFVTVDNWDDDDDGHH